MNHERISELPIIDDAEAIVEFVEKYCGDLAQSVKDILDDTVSGGLGATLGSEFRVGVMLANPGQVCTVYPEEIESYALLAVKVEIESGLAVDVLRAYILNFTDVEVSSNSIEMVEANHSAVLH